MKGFFMKKYISIVLIVLFLLTLSTISYGQSLNIDSNKEFNNVKFEIIQQPNKSQTTIGTVAKIDNVSESMLKGKIEIPYAGAHPILITLIIIIAIAVIAFICYRVIEI